VPAGTRFCGQCGAAITGPSPSAAAPPKVDIRQTVEGDRGALKKLQLLIPGFRGYRLGEDIRDADSILRREVADKLVDAMTQIQTVRQNLVQANQYGSLNDLALILSDVTILEGHIRHAEQGYSGISAPIRIQPKDLDRLYEYDYGFAMAADQLRGQVPPLGAAAQANDAARVSSEVARLRGLVTQLSSAFQARLATIEGIRV
jgi:hypothetical protein